jgi:hypothetical protein
MVKGIIYKLVEITKPDIVVYVGSTVLTLSQRFCLHKSDTKTCPSPVYVYINERGGITKFTIVLLEEGDFESRRMVRKREDDYQQELKPLTNVTRAYFDGKYDYNKYKEQRAGYRLKHKPEKAAYDKLYNEQNAEKIAARSKGYYKNNKERDRPRNLQYKLRNKEKLKAQNAERITCRVCGREVRRGGVAEHRRSTKHKDALCRLGVQF